MDAIEFIGFHGSDAVNEASIMEKGFQAGSGENTWMGPGVYFFVEGCSASPAEDARYWVEAEQRNRNSTRYVVFQVKVRCGKLLDLRTSDGLIAFNHLRDKVYRQLELFSPTEKFDDSIDTKIADLALLRFLKEILKFDSIIGNFYTRRKIQRMKRLRSNIPNVCILCVDNRLQSVDISEIRPVSCGDI